MTNQEAYNLFSQMLDAKYLLSLDTSNKDELQDEFLKNNGLSKLVLLSEDTRNVLQNAFEAHQKRAADATFVDNKVQFFGLKPLGDTDETLEDAYCLPRDLAFKAYRKLIEKHGDNIGMRDVQINDAKLKVANIDSLYFDEHRVTLKVIAPNNYTNPLALRDNLQHVNAFVKKYTDGIKGAVFELKEDQWGLTQPYISFTTDMIHLEQGAVLSSDSKGNISQVIEPYDGPDPKPVFYDEHIWTPTAEFTPQPREQVDEAKIEDEHLPSGVDDTDDEEKSVDAFFDDALGDAQYNHDHMQDTQTESKSPYPKSDESPTAVEMSEEDAQAESSGDIDDKQFTGPEVVDKIHIAQSTSNQNEVKIKAMVNQDKETFVIGNLNGIEDDKETGFFAWIDDRQKYDSLHDRDVQNIGLYLGEIGYNPKKHTLDKEQVLRLRRILLDYKRELAFVNDIIQSSMPHVTESAPHNNEPEAPTTTEAEHHDFEPDAPTTTEEEHHDFEPEAPTTTEAEHHDFEPEAPTTTEAEVDEATVSEKDNKRSELGTHIINSIKCAAAVDMYSGDFYQDINLILASAGKSISLADLSAKQIEILKDFYEEAEKEISEPIAEGTYEHPYYTITTYGDFVNTIYFADHDTLQAVKEAHSNGNFAPSVIHINAEQLTGRVESIKHTHNGDIAMSMSIHSPVSGDKIQHLKTVNPGLSAEIKNNCHGIKGFELGKVQVGYGNEMPLITVFCDRTDFITHTLVRPTPDQYQKIMANDGDLNDTTDIDTQKIQPIEVNEAPQEASQGDGIEGPAPDYDESSNEAESISKIETGDDAVLDDSIEQIDSEDFGIDDEDMDMLDAMLDAPGI